MARRRLYRSQGRQEEVIEMNFGTLANLSQEVVFDSVVAISSVLLLSGVCFYARKCLNSSGAARRRLEFQKWKNNSKVK